MNEKTTYILDAFEKFLDDRGIFIPNEDRENDDDASLYGSDYFQLEAVIDSVLSDPNMTAYREFMADGFIDHNIKDYLIEVKDHGVFKVCGRSAYEAEETARAGLGGLLNCGNEDVEILSVKKV